jgi:PP-loop superfamily ATP-utilizing enzyme
MPERFSDIEKACRAKQNEGKEEIRPADRELIRRLGEYPELKAKMEAMLAIIENAGGDVEKAAEAERRIIEELRQMGSEVLHRWARRQQRKKEEAYNAQPGVNRKEKKSSPGTRD